METPHLERRLGFTQATALNMVNMVGAGPFITIPLLMSAMGGPQALLGWVVAILITIPDGMVWSELGAALPGSGGSMGQTAAVILLRRSAPNLARPYRIWFYPLPCLLALVGWTFVFVTSGWQVVVYAIVALAAGVVVFGIKKGAG